jgi:signal transduction histidine kinase
MFYQTFWFSSAGIAALVIGTWAAWRVHLRRVRKSFALILGERARLSREIHDTLLQSLVGMALQCDAIAGGLDDSSHATKDELVRMRKQVEQYIREARQSILDLRSPRLQRQDLASALREAGHQAVAGQHIAFDFTAAGNDDRYPPKIEEQLLRIGQEAVLNAVRHARPSRIRMELRREHHSLTLRVADDGCGFNPTLVAAAVNGHYGLISMKERADILGATLHITSSVGRGTEIEAVVPLSSSVPSPS